jgi:SpoVK/Ycf46/Vps4 family AAA+-type ATPase
VSAIAQLHDFPICVFDLPSMSNKDFKRYWSESRSYSPCIVLIEDIDNVFQGRTNITKGDTADSLTFDCLLNTISGVQDSDGILLIITTNNIERLDEALGKPRTDKHINGTFISTRPGRVDRVLELKTMDEDCRRRLASRILNESPEFIEKLIKDGDGDTGAQFQERCSQVALSEYWRKKKL